MPGHVPPKIEHQLKKHVVSWKSGFQALGPASLDSSPKYYYFRVFMCPELRYGPGSDTNRVWDTPSKTNLKISSIFAWLKYFDAWSCTPS